MGGSDICKHFVSIDLHDQAFTFSHLKSGSSPVRRLAIVTVQLIMGAVMAALSVEARRRLSRPSCLSHCGHSAARYHRSGRNRQCHIITYLQY